MRLSMHPPLVLLLPLVLGAGCGGPPFKVTDSFTPPPEGPFASAEDSLHQYAVGTAFAFDVRTARAFVDLDAVKVVSKDPDVLLITNEEKVDDHLHVTVLAQQEGTAALAFLDEDDRPMEERVVEVKRADEVLLSVNIDDDKGFTIPAVKKDAILVAAGGTVTFRVQYLRDGQELKGSGILTGVSDVIASVNPTRDNPDREFFTLNAPKDPTPAVPLVLKVAGSPVRALEVRTTSLDEIKKIELDEGDQGTHWNGSVYSVWAKAFDKDAKPIFGAPFAWSFDGDDLDDSGDLLFYTHAGGERRRVQVRAGDEVEDVTVEAKKGSAKVAKTADPGCAGALPGSVVALALLLRRRRRGAGPRAALR
jgi:hypothetical protein